MNGCRPTGGCGPRASTSWSGTWSGCPIEGRPMNSTEQQPYGTVERLDDGRWRLRFTRTLPYPREKVWRAITEPEHLEHWFPTTIEGERAAGAPLRFAFPKNQAPPMEGQMLAYEAESFM